MKPRKSKTVAVADAPTRAEATAAMAPPPPPFERVAEILAAAEPSPVPDVCPVDLTPVRRAAEAAGFGIYTIAVYDDRIIVTAGQAVVEGADVETLVAAIRAYNCKHCGSGGSHTPNCGRPR